MVQIYRVQASAAGYLKLRQGPVEQASRIWSRFLECRLLVLGYLQQVLVLVLQPVQLAQQIKLALLVLISVLEVLQLVLVLHLHECICSCCRAQLLRQMMLEDCPCIAYLWEFC